MQHWIRHKKFDLELQIYCLNLNRSAWKKLKKNFTLA